MIHTPENCRNKILVDVSGNAIPYVQSYDDETGETTLFIRGSNGEAIKTGASLQEGLSLVKVKTVIIGAKLIDKP